MKYNFYFLENVKYLRNLKRRNIGVEHRSEDRNYYTENKLRDYITKI